MNSKNLISIVIPVYNEAKGLKQFIMQLISAIEKKISLYEIILIDDGSKDETWQEIKKLKQNVPCIKAIKFTRNFGKEAAILAGLKKSKGRAVIVMDADLQHPPDLIPQMVKIWESTGILIVEAVKKQRQKENQIKRILTNIFYKIFNLLSGINLKDNTDFKLLDCKVVDIYLEMPERFRFFRGLIKWLGYKHAVIYFNPPPRQIGHSKWDFLKLFNFAWQSIVAFSPIPLRVITFLGIFILLLAIFIGLKTLYLKFIGRAVRGFSTVIMLQLVIGSSLMIGLGILGEYIAKIYEEIKKRPLYVVEKEIE